VGELNHWYREYGNRRGSYQQSGTWWTYKNIQQVGRKQTDRLEQLLHTISNEPVSFTNDGDPAERNLLDEKFRDERR
jgi:ketosteroid isomerase-like protein